MNWKAWTPLAVAIVLGLLAARLAMEVVGTGVPAAQHAANFVPMVVAARDIEPGTTLQPTDLVMGKADRDMVPTGSFTDISAVANRVTKFTVARGQPLLPTVLAEEGAGYGVAATLPEGMRAITLEINDVSGVAGFITPQSKVDVVATLQSDGKPTAKTLLEGITVLACGGRTNPGAPATEPARTVTLLVKPDQAERLELAVSTSRVRLVLRNGRDKSRSETDGITLADLKGESDASGVGTDPFVATATVTSLTTQPSGTPQAAPASGKANWTVEIIRAGQTSTQTFEMPAQKPEAPAREPKAELKLSDSEPNKID